MAAQGKYSSLRFKAIASSGVFLMAGVAVMLLADDFKLTTGWLANLGDWLVLKTSLPNWALHEYSARGYVKAKRLGEKGLFATLYAAVRTDMLDAPYMRDFLLTAKDTSFANLEGVSVARS